MKPKKHKSRFVDPGGGYRAHSQAHKSKREYDRNREKKLIEQAKHEEE